MDIHQYGTYFISIGLIIISIVFSLGSMKVGKDQEMLIDSNIILARKSIMISLSFIVVGFLF